MNEETVTAYKGFDGQMQCRGFQFEVGKDYEVAGEVKVCENGFHACEYPLGVFAYYPPASSRFAVVEQAGDLSRDGGDTKVASRRISIKAELSLAGLIRSAVRYTASRCGPVDVGSPASATGRYGAASATGRYGAASATGDRGAASATGYQGAASATGDQGAASATGYQGAASATGDQGAASATGDQGAASATGDQGAASATGYQGAASATGRYGAASATGYRGKARGSEGSAIFLVFRDTSVGYGDPEYGRILHAKAAIVGQDGVNPDTWYSLNEHGDLVEVTA